MIVFFVSLWINDPELCIWEYRIKCKFLFCFGVVQVNFILIWINFESLFLMLFCCYFALLFLTRWTTFLFFKFDRKRRTRTLEIIEQISIIDTRTMFAIFNYRLCFFLALMFNFQHKYIAWNTRLYLPFSILIVLNSYFYVFMNTTQDDRIIP